MSRRIQVIGAHSADFVWRAAGAIALVTAVGGVAEVIALSYGERGALLERCFTTPHAGKASWELICRASREVGAVNTVWSSDLGQVFNPAVEAGLALMADQFLAAGFSDEDVITMAVTNTRLLAGEAPS